MTHDEFMNQIKHMLGEIRSDAYKAGFQDGVRFAAEPSDSLIAAVDKAKTFVLSQVDTIYGMGKEYKLVSDCLEAVMTDLKNAAHLVKPKSMQDFWDDEYGDDL